MMMRAGPPLQVIKQTNKRNSDDDYGDDDDDIDDNDDGDGDLSLDFPAW